MSTSLPSWWQRSGSMVSYAGELQGTEPNCVYAAVAGAVNHLEGKKLWIAEELYKKHQPRPTDFSVADTALATARSVDKLHHVKGPSVDPLSPDLIRQWLAEGSIVILSRELGKPDRSRSGAWHMFSLIAHSKDGFQVWDSNDLKGFLTDDEVVNGFDYPQSGWIFLPHAFEDTLVLKKIAPANEPKQP